jgi:hypothetical protein
MAWQVSTLSNDQVNPAPNAVQDPMSQSDKDISYKRQFAIRRDTDKVKNISIDLQDVDGTIIDFLNNKLNLQVMDNGEVVKVPIIYGSPERWTAMKKEGFIRDNQGKILLPAFMLRRSDVQNNKDRATFNRYLAYQAIVPYSEKNKYDRFEVMNNNILFNSRPTKQIFTVSMPKQVLVTYECVIWTDYVDQNNKLLEQITYACNDYWGDKERLKFIVNADSFTTDIEMDDNNDRNVKTTFNLVVTAYLLNPSFVPGIEGIKNTTQKMFTIRKIKLNEAAVDGEQMDDIKNNVKQYGFEDTTSIKDKDKDFAYVDGIGVQSIPSNTIKDGNPIIKKTTSITKTPFHAPPKSSKEYGENGWVAYDSNYLYIYQYPLGWIRRAISVFDYDPTTSTYISGYNDCDQPIYTTSSRRPINTAFRIFQRFPDKFYQQTPIQSGDYGEDGWISYDGSYLYIYSAGSWRRIVTALFETF